MKQAWIKAARQNKGMSQKELAAAVGVSQTTISILETEDIDELTQRIKAVLKTEGGNGMTQNEQVLEYMRRNGKITQRDAARHLDCYRLGARIFELRRAGHTILTARKPFATDSGHGAYAEYRLVEE